MDTVKANEVLRELRSKKLVELSVEEVEALGIVIDVMEEKICSIEPEIFDSSAKECQIHPDFKCYSQKNCKGNPQICDMAAFK